MPRVDYLGYPLEPGDLVCYSSADPWLSFGILLTEGATPKLYVGTYKVRNNIVKLVAEWGRLDAKKVFEYTVKSPSYGGPVIHITQGYRDRILKHPMGNVMTYGGLQPSNVRGCAWCGEEFHAISLNNTLCSDACREESSLWHAAEQAAKRKRKRRI